MIELLTLRNFKAFREQELPLGAYTLLSGLNSSGKSTVLQAMALLRQSHDRGLLDDGREARTDLGGLLLNGELVELGFGRDVLHEDYQRSEGGAARIELGVTVGPDQIPSTWSAEYQPENDLLPISRLDVPTDIDNPLFGPHFQYLKADRVVPAVSFPRSYDAAVRRRWLGARGEHTVNFLRHHQDEGVAEELRHAASRSSRLADQTEAWMQEVCPGVNLDTVGIEGTDQVRLSFQFGTAGFSASNRYRPTNVGFGLTYVLPIVVACLTARPGALLLLENPEAHVHPRGQTAMARLTCNAARAGAQVIVETHSDHVLNGVRIAVKEAQLRPHDVAFHFFSRASGSVRIESPVVGADGMLSAWPEGFFDEWDRSLDRLLD
jgi:predicted ATPase